MEINNMVKIIVVDDKIAVHHYTCNRRNTLIIEWPLTHAIGLSLKKVVEAVAAHDCGKE